jgi:hypothetical protein
MTEKAQIKALQGVAAIEFGVIFGMGSGIAVRGFDGPMAMAVGTGLTMFVVSAGLILGLIKHLKDD